MGIGEHDNRLMKLEILLGISLDIFFAERLTKALNAGSQLGEVVLMYLLGSQIGRKAFQILTDEEELKDVFLGKLDNESAPLRENFYQAFFL